MADRPRAPVANFPLEDLYLGVASLLIARNEIEIPEVLPEQAAMLFGHTPETTWHYSARIAR